MPKLRARRATSRPMRPRPRMPSFLSRSSAPCSDFFSHFPACMVALARGSCRASAIMRPSASSATAMAFAPGVFITTMPRRVAASASMLSTPTPARPITRSFGARPSAHRPPAPPSARPAHRRRPRFGQVLHLIVRQHLPSGLRLKNRQQSPEKLFPPERLSSFPFRIGSGLSALRREPSPARWLWRACALRRLRSA